MTALQGQVALVTGASRGIGRAIAIALARAGATVIGTATTQSGADTFGQDLQANALQGAGIAMNVNDAAQVQTGLAEIQKHHGDVAILVNNAGITRDNLLMRMKEEEWDEIMATNLKSIYRLSKAVVRGMTKARYGRIINITSVIGATGNAGQTNYAAAKAGAVGFSKALAREVGSRNVTVNCVAPGFIDTDMTRGLGEEQRKGLLAQIPLARLGHVDDIAEAVLFLAGPGASYITGCTLHVNGGMHMD
jgi:3-oxoacyl-[acyl-carrier protein] reductase